MKKILFTTTLALMLFLAPASLSAERIIKPNDFELVAHDSETMQSFELTDDEIITNANLEVQIKGDTVDLTDDQYSDLLSMTTVNTDSVDYTTPGNYAITFTTTVTGHGHFYEGNQYIDTVYLNVKPRFVMHSDDYTMATTSESVTNDSLLKNMNVYLSDEAKLFDDVVGNSNFTVTHDEIDTTNPGVYEITFELSEAYPYTVPSTSTLTIIGPDATLPEVDPDELPGGINGPVAPTLPEVTAPEVTAPEVTGPEVTVTDDNLPTIANTSFFTTFLILGSTMLVLFVLIGVRIWYSKKVESINE